jgi:hypothetical protein
VLRRARGWAGALFDIDLVARPSWYAAYAAAGRNARVASIARRISSPFVRVPVPPPGPYVFGQELDFRDSATSDHYAGPGWWTVDELGLRSHGAEARIVLDLAEHHRGVELDLDVRSSGSSERLVEVRVNERAVSRFEVPPVDVEGHVCVRVPASVVQRFQPMEIALLAARRGPRRLRGRVGVCLLRLRVRPS